MQRCVRTEEEWWAWEDFHPLFWGHLKGKLSARKARLFACACCRAIWGLLQDPRSRTAVETAEHYADTLTTRHELTAAWEAAQVAARALRQVGDEVVKAGNRADSERVHAKLFAAGAARDASHPRDAAGDNGALGRRTASAAVFVARSDQVRVVYYRRFADLLRHIVGNPFRPTPINPAWLTPTVVQLACAIYDERRFADLPVLADALEEAGCADAEILGHCRGPGPHPLGCWAVDSLLGKG